MAQAPQIVPLSYNYWTDRASAPVVAIIAHNTVGYDSRAYLSRGGELPDGSDRKVSIHSLIRKDGTLYRYVPDERGANHAGYGVMPPQFPRINPNRCTIGFELENASNGLGRVDPYTEEQLLSMGWEINRIRAKFGNLSIYRHAEIDPKRRRDTVGLTVVEMNEWAHKAMAHFATYTPYICVSPCTPFIARNPSAPLAEGCVFAAGDIVNVGQVQDGWLWVSDKPDTPPGIGFIPVSYARKV